MDKGEFPQLDSVVNASSFFSPCRWAVCRRNELKKNNRGRQVCGAPAQTTQASARQRPTTQKARRARPIVCGEAEKTQQDPSNAAMRRLNGRARGRRAAPRSCGFGGEPSFSGMVLMLCHLRIAPSQPAPVGRGACGLIARPGRGSRASSARRSCLCACARSAGQARPAGGPGWERRSSVSAPRPAFHLSVACPSPLRLDRLRRLYFPREGLIIG